ncbi:AAA family ATPase [Candidatus Dependentiae bacterium]|nr:AAA family ATPase [Candidatus Dependentiae bacterium]
MWSFKVVSISIILAYGLWSRAELQAPFDFDYALLQGTSSPELHDDFRDAYKTIDEVSSLLQHIVQILNKNVLPISNKPQAKAWLFEHVTIAYSLRKIDEKTSEQTLFKLLSTTKSFISHVIRTVNSDLQNLEIFEVPYIQEPPILAPENHDSLTVLIHKLVGTNKILLNQLENRIRTLGLSWINLAARKLDSLDTKYGITKIVEQLPRFAGLGGLALYFIPETSVENIPLAGTLKKHIGSPGYRERTESTNNEPLTVADYHRGPDIKALQVLVPLALSMLSQDFYNYGITPIRRFFRPLWNSLKGFEILYSSQQKYKYPGITLEDPRLIGLNSQIEEMRKVVQYILDPETFDRANCSIEKGILLEGPSRTGKTLLANALCGTINEQLQRRGIYKQFAFRKIKAAEIYHTYNGIRGLIQEAKENAPCVLFIDELHTLNLQTKEGGGGDMLTQFLTMAEELHSNDIGDAVILLGATNRAHLLDDALLKPERFGNIIHFENPTPAMRKRYFMEMFNYNALNPLLFDTELLVRQTEGCSYGDLDLIFKAARFSARSKSKTVSQNDFEEKIYQYIYRVNEPTQSSLSQEEKKVIAAHVAGQTLFYFLYEKELYEKLEVATIRGIWPKIEEIRFFDTEAVKVAREKNKIYFGAIFTSHQSERRLISTNPEIACKIKLAGMLAQEIILGKACYTYRPQEKREAFVLLEQEAYKGLSKEHFTLQEQAVIMVEVRRKLHACEEETRISLRKHTSLLKRLALELETKELLAAQDIKRLLEDTEV